MPPEAIPQWLTDGMEVLLCFLNQKKFTRPSWIAVVYLCNADATQTGKSIGAGPAWEDPNNQDYGVGKRKKTAGTREMTDAEFWSMYDEENRASRHGRSSEKNAVAALESGSVKLCVPQEEKHAEQRYGLNTKKQTCRLQGH